MKLIFLTYWKDIQPLIIRLLIYYIFTIYIRKFQGLGLKPYPWSQYWWHNGSNSQLLIVPPFSI
jgi:hypothetical protein